MNFLSQYLIPSTACITLLYAVYLIFLRRETFFGINRLYLTGSVIFSIIFPFIRTGSGTENTPGGTTVSIVLDNITVTPASIEKAFPSGSDLFSILAMIYIAGIIFLSFTFLFRIFRIILLINKTQKSGHGYRVIYNEDESPVFSFFRMIFISSSIKDEKELRQVLSHEKIHAKHFHSLDVVLTELFLIIQWFNPAVWLLRHSVKVNHEYIADRGVVEMENDYSSYCNLLLNASYSRAGSLTNNFNYSLLKNRIVMITKNRSRGYAGLKTIMAVPVILGLFLIFPSGVNTSLALEKQANSSSFKTTEIKSDTTPKKVKIEKFEEVKQMPQFPGGTDELVKYLASSIKYPEKAKKEGIMGKVYISFEVDSKGKIGNVKVKRSDNEIFNEEAIRVVASMPDWQPGLNAEGKPIDVNYVIPISFKLSKKDSK